jgi:hypothetical protein
VVFTDETLDPIRTTREKHDALRDRESCAIPGDEFLVDVGAYTDQFAEPVWCEYAYDVPGSAAVYPYKVYVPGRGFGQFRADEVLGWRRPLKLHQLLNEIAELEAAHA